MKYGETLRQRSIPAWSHYNIDYDDIKQYIKEQTTPGKGKTVAVPGRTDEKLQQFENSLFLILKEQYYRIDLFVRSKAGEIQRRLEHSKRQLKSLSTPTTLASDRRIPVGRLERYGKLENDVLKAGDEIRSLARFTSTQRTAFRKLLKKYKKWTGSTQLEDRLRSDVLDDPKSFVKLDLGPLLDDYSTTLQQIRSLYEFRVRQRSSGEALDATAAGSASSVVGEIQTALDSGSKVAFDTAIATTALGDTGTFASYFVHPENLVELQVLLLQHSRYHLTRSRSDSVASPLTSTPENEVSDTDNADFFALEADDAERFAKEENALTIVDREHRAGSTPQKARLCIRWTKDEEARVAYQPRSSVYHYATMRRKYVNDLASRDGTFSAKKAAVSAENEESLAAVKQKLEKNGSVKPLYLFSSSRSRFVGTNNSSQRLMMATLDTQMVIKTAGGADANASKSSFPFAVLLVRQEGSVTEGLLASLDQSHLVERVRGFSMEYHAIWQTTNSPNIPAPFWLPVLDRDIRKLPPPAIKRLPSRASSADRTPTSRGSMNGVTDSTTAVDTARSDSATQELEAPPLRALRKKRRRVRTLDPIAQKQPKYWSEYDHPEDGEDQDAYVIYMDPNQKSALDAVFERLGGLFTRRGKTVDEEENLLGGSSTPKDSESSDDEEDNATVKPRARSYGTLVQQPLRVTSGSQRITSTHTAPSTKQSFLPQMTAISYVASLVILFVAYILASTGRHKLRYQVDFGVLFAVSSSLFFAVAGFASLLRQQNISYLGWGVGVLVLVLDAVGSGGLLAWMLG